MDKNHHVYIESTQWWTNEDQVDNGKKIKVDSDANCIK